MGDVPPPSRAISSLSSFLPAQLTLPLRRTVPSYDGCQSNCSRPVEQRVPDRSLPQRESPRPLVSHLRIDHKPREVGGVHAHKKEEEVEPRQ